MMHTLFSTTLKALFTSYLLSRLKADTFIYVEQHTGLPETHTELDDKMLCVDVVRCCSEPHWSAGHHRDIFRQRLLQGLVLHSIIHMERDISIKRQQERAQALLSSLTA